LLQEKEGVTKENNEISGKADYPFVFSFDAQTDTSLRRRERKVKKRKGTTMIHRLPRGGERVGTKQRFLGISTKKERGGGSQKNPVQLKGRKETTEPGNSRTKSDTVSGDHISC